MTKEIVLASTSPRRKILLEKIVPSFQVIAPSLEEEVLSTALPLGKALEKLALEKASSVSKAYPDAVVIGADTIVALEGEVLGKPCDEAEANAMLSRLSGVAHQVYTAVAVVCETNQLILTAHEVTQVYFKKLSKAEIEAYIATGEPMDKAGAYGIQGEGGKLVASFEGDFDNVVGLPVTLLEKLLQECEANNNERAENKNF